MNTRAKIILATVALAAGASALGAQAADQSAFFEQQREITDFPPVSFVDTPAREKPATSHQTAESKWFDVERARPTGVAQAPFPVPATRVAAAPRPATREHTVAEDNWLTAERTEGSVSDAPIAYPVTNR